MVRNGAGWTPLTVAIRAGREQNALALLEHDAHPNLQDTLGLAPLHHAVLVRSAVIVAALLKKGADRTLTDDEGRTALDYAQAIEAQHLADLLVDK